MNKCARYFSVVLLMSIASVSSVLGTVSDADFEALKSEVAELRKSMPRVVDVSSMMQDIQEEGQAIQQKVIGKYEPKMRAAGEELNALQQKLADAKEDAKPAIQKDMEDKRKKAMDIQKAAEAEMKKEAERLEKKATDKIDLVKGAAKELGASTIIDKSVCISCDTAFSDKVKSKVNAAKPAPKAEEKADTAKQPAPRAKA